MTPTYLGTIILQAPSSIPPAIEQMIAEQVKLGYLEPITSNQWRIVQPETKKLAPDFGFADFWSEYPRRNGRLVGKKKALERWSKFDLDTRRLALRATKQYARACDSNTTIAKDPERFLLKDYWRDWLEDAAVCDHERPRGVPDNATFDPITGTWVVL